MDGFIYLLHSLAKVVTVVPAELSYHKTHILIIIQELAYYFISVLEMNLSHIELHVLCRYFNSKQPHNIHHQFPQLVAKSCFGNRLFQNKSFMQYS